VRQGYAWAFPLGNGHLHIGVGSFVEDLDRALARAGFLWKDDMTICSCTSAVRLGATMASRPFHAGKMWGVGESIGTVSPLVGDGILPSMRCASLFAALLRDGALDRYEERVRAEFSWMDAERAVVDRMIARNGQVALGDLLLMREHAGRFGMQVGLGWILSWILGRRILGRFP
jgi:flavin-dependent dehydrogenase